MFGSAWRSFKFFESTALNDPPLLPPSIEIVSCCLSHAYLFIGDCGGQIHVIDRSSIVSSSSGSSSGGGRKGSSGDASSHGGGSRGQRRSAATVIASFQAYTGPVTHMKYLRSRNVLATLGDDDTLNTTILRLWQVDQCVELVRGGRDESTPRAGAFTLWRPPSREHRLFSAQHPTPSASGSVLVKVNQNEERLRTLRLRAGGRRPESPSGSSPSAAAQPGGEEDNSIPATSLLTVVVAFDISEDAQNCVVALTSGDCVVLHGDLEKDRAVRVRRIRSGSATGKIAFAGFPPRSNVVIQTGAAYSASGAAVKRSDTQNGNSKSPRSGLQVLYVVYESMTTLWGISGTGEYTEYPCHEGSRLAAASVGCACMSADGKLIVCGNTDGCLTVLGPNDPASTERGKAKDSSAVSVFDPTAAAASRSGPSSHTQPSQSGIASASVTALPIADDGTGGNRKVRLLWHGGYAVLLSESPSRPEQFHLQCYDTVNCIRALSRNQESHTDVAFVLSDGVGALLVLSQAPGQREALAYHAISLKEIDTLSKLDLLFSKECYGIAKSIADHQSQGVDATLRQLIEKRYADYLYAKGKYGEAMEEYVACIGSLEPSYVIRRYMQGQHIGLLTRYLEELHQRSHGYVAHVSHTTLLLNCYIRQEDEAKLLAFVRRDNVRFDAPNAIAVCRQGGYYEAALLIADKYAQVYERASILIHDLQQPDNALDYIHTLGVDDAEDILKKAGKQLIAWEPSRTTDTLLQLCVGWKGPARRLPADLSTQRNMKPAKRADATDFLHVFVDSPVCLFNFLRGIVASGVLESEADATSTGETSTPAGDATSSADLRRQGVYDTLFELYITKDLRQSIRIIDADDTDKESSPTAAAGDSETGVPVGEPLPQRLEQAMTFLEACAGRYDDYVALSLCHQHHFEQGIVFLLRKLRLSTDLINYYGDKMATAKTEEDRRDAKAKLLLEVEALDEHQQPRDSDPGAAGEVGLTRRKATWMTLLTLLVQSPQTEWQDVVKVLDRIESRSILTPTVVMEILCAPQSQLQLRTVRAYCQRAMRRQFDGMKAAQEQTAQRLQRIEELKTSITSLQASAVIFPCAQCAHCGQPLDFPAVHFMCRHSFHQRCLNISTQCNLCAAEHQKVLDSLKEQQESVRSSDGVNAFFARLGHGDSNGGGLAVVNEYVAKGILGSSSFTSSALAATARKPEASLYAADPLIRVSRGEGTGKEVYDSKGDVLNAETVEWW